MPTTKSAKKRLRQNEKRKTINRSRKSAMRTQVKKFLEAIKNKDIQAAEEEFRLAVKKVDEGAARGILHKKNADRKKARFAKKLNSIKISLQEEK